MSRDNLIGHYVKVSESCGITNLRGKIGYVKSFGGYLNEYYMVKFTFDVGSYTMGGRPTYEMYLPIRSLHLVEDDDETLLLDEDIETLIDKALETKDKAWFDELLLKSTRLAL